MIIRVKSLVSEAGASFASWHTFRHTCASMLFAEGRNIKQVQRWLGHHSPDFTLRTYVHLLSDGVGSGLTLGACSKPTGVAMGLAVFPAEEHVDRELVEAA